MASMREIKLRIRSINETKQITNAMKLISAAKLKKARQQLEQTKPYFKEVETTMADILAHSRQVDNIYLEERIGKPNKKTGIIILTGDKGLAGGYNHNILKLAEDMVNDAENPVLFVAGQMGYNYYLRKKYNVAEEFDYPVQNPTVFRAREIQEIILDKFKKGEVDEVYMAFTEMVSSIKLIPQAIRLLPLNLDVLKANFGLSDIKAEAGAILNYEPSAGAVFDKLVPKYINGIIYGAFVESFTSEQSARMTAMDSATDNANEMLQRLNLHYNRARQSAITQEISEIVSGAAAL